MDVTVLGHRGMLGSVVARYFAQQGATVHTTDLRFDGSDELPRWATNHGFVINCIRGGWLENAILPLRLVQMGFLIQPSTDAHRENTDYAWTKSWGESGFVIRAGIIDIDNQPDPAFVNWHCNPLTPLEWARVAYNIVRFRVRVPLHEIGRETVSRYDIASAVAELWNRPAPAQLIATESNRRVIRSQDRYPCEFPPLRDALIEYREWLRS